MRVLTFLKTLGCWLWLHDTTLNKVNLRFNNVLVLAQEEPPPFQIETRGCAPGSSGADCAKQLLIKRGPGETEQHGPSPRVTTSNSSLATFNSANSAGSCPPDPKPNKKFWTGKKNKKGKPIMKKCTWLQKRKPRIIKKICKIHAETEGGIVITTAKELCTGTCDTCDKQDDVCADSSKLGSKFTTKLEVCDSVEIVEDNCVGLANRASEEIVALCNDGIKWREKPTAAEMCPTTCDNCGPTAFTIPKFDGIDSLYTAEDGTIVLTSSYPQNIDQTYEKELVYSIFLAPGEYPFSEKLKTASIPELKKYWLYGRLKIFLIFLLKIINIST